MSTLYMMGLKQGDTQMTCAGLVTAGLFFFVSQAKPLHHLSSTMPPCSVFDTSVVFSICGQFIVHFIALSSTIYLCSESTEKAEVTFQHENIAIIRNVKNNPDTSFQPNLLNSTIFLLSFSVQISNFIVNYRGYPFTENIWDNKLFWRSLQIIYFFLFVIVSGVFEPLNDLLQLVPFPSLFFYYAFGSIILLDLVGAWGVEKLSHLLERKQNFDNIIKVIACQEANNKIKVE